jgi:peptide/nickel transport system substrate-binding protein
MLPSFFRYPVFLNLYLCLGLLSVFASDRPHYGNTLHVKTRIQLRTLDSGEWPADSQEAATRMKLSALLYEPLVAVNLKGEPQLILAVSWDADAAKRRWEFRLRAGLKLHDNSPLTPALAVQSLAKSFPEYSIMATGETITIQAPRPVPELLGLLAQPKNFIAVPASDGKLLGTGLFRLAAFEPARRIHLEAFEGYREGRPYLDAVELEFDRPLREQWMDFELGKADVVELGPDQWRQAQQRSQNHWSSSPLELIALYCSRGCPALSDPRLREALALSIDKPSIHRVLLQKQGELATALLPQWLSGYAFLYAGGRDIEKARQLVAQLPLSNRQLTMVCPSGDATARSIAERIAVNSRDAGLTLRVVPAATAARWPMNPATCDLVLFRLRLNPSCGEMPLNDLIQRLALDPSKQMAWMASLEARYSLEREILSSHEVIPLFHLPAAYALSSRVKGWPAPDTFQKDEWPFANVWIGTASTLTEKPRHSGSKFF